MGFGLPAAIGAKVAHPDTLVVDIDGDGSLLMNIQEMATCFCEKVPVKVLLLNNQHLGMVVQWEDRFHASNRAHTYLGPIDHPEAIGRGTGIGPEQRYPDFVAVAAGFGWQGRFVSREERAGRRPARDDRLARSVPARRGRALPGARLADDPLGNDGARADKAVARNEPGRPGRAIAKNTPVRFNAFSYCNVPNMHTEGTMEAIIGSEACDPPRSRSSSHGDELLSAGRDNPLLETDSVVQDPVPVPTISPNCRVHVPDQSESRRTA